MNKTTNTKQYPYNSTINIDLVMEHFNNFIPDLNLENNYNIKYITLFIELEYTDHRGNSKRITLCKWRPVDLKSKMTIIKTQLTQNIKVLFEYFKGKEFNTVLFNYNIINYTKFRSLKARHQARKIRNKSNILKALIKTNTK